MERKELTKDYRKSLLEQLRTEYETEVEEGDSKNPPHVMAWCQIALERAAQYIEAGRDKLGMPNIIIPPVDCAEIWIEKGKYKAFIRNGVICLWRVE